MVTVITNDNTREYRGLSSDEKPVNVIPFDPTDKDPKAYVGNGSIFFEIDTCDIYIFDEANNY